jgi:hypothetical protein
MENTFEKLLIKAFDADLMSMIFLRSQLTIQLVNSGLFYFNTFTCQKYGIDNRN